MPDDRRNITYETSAIADYFATHRERWDQFYPSERRIFERLASKASLGRILDVGCAAGGLGLALGERFDVQGYVGVDINREVVSVAERRRSQFRSPVDFRVGDILTMKDEQPFDTVVSLSCADWNIDTNAIIDACWRRVAASGWLVISLRLTNAAGLNDFTKSYQYIRYTGPATPTDEKANYVVFNVHDALRMFASLASASKLLGYGYWGAPSSTAVTPFERLVFAVFAVRKGAGSSEDITSELEFPLTLWTSEAVRVQASNR